MTNVMHRVALTLIKGWTTIPSWEEGRKEPRRRGELEKGKFETDLQGPAT